MKIGNTYFDIKRHTYIVGILNLTPDSFSDGGKHNTGEKALRACEKMVADGASIIDVGGESTRPGFTPVSADEETERTAPVIRRIKENFDIPVSIDTTKALVAWAALSAGADMINDVSGLMGDRDMAGLAADHEVPVCITHNSAYFADEGHGLRCDMANGFMISLDRAVAAGIDDRNIILDPGIGFKRSYEQDMEILAADDLYLPKGFAAYLGVSRKSVIGKTLDVPVDQRLTGTLAVTAMAVMRHIPFVRVHDVKENAEAVRMLEEIREYRKEKEKIYRVPR